MYHVTTCISCDLLYYFQMPSQLLAPSGQAAEIQYIQPPLQSGTYVQYQPSNNRISQQLPARQGAQFTTRPAVEPFPPSLCMSSIILTPSHGLQGKWVIGLGRVGERSQTLTKGVFHLNCHFLDMPQS